MWQLWILDISYNQHNDKLLYSRTSVAQTLVARFPCLTRTCSWVGMIPHMRLLWSNSCIYVLMLLFSFSIFGDRWSLKVENENNNMNYLTAEAPYIGLLVYKYRNLPWLAGIEIYPGWLELSLTRTNFHGPKPVSATEVVL